MDASQIEQWSGVSETLLIPLYCRAVESQSENPIISDPRAVAITRELNEHFRRSPREMQRWLASGKLPTRLSVSLALRTRHFDRCVQTFVAAHPEGVVINLGCGLDTRFFRLDNGQVRWFDLDFPEVIAVRRAFLEETERHVHLGSSALDLAWMNDPRLPSSGPVLVLAEGLFMYLTEPPVKELLLALQRRFPGCELVAEVFSAAWVKRMQHPLLRRKYRRQLHMAEDATFRFGISDSRAFEAWGPGIRFLDDWTYFDDRERKLGLLMSLLGRLEALRKIQWTVRYRLN
ncbi:MAG: class I SAM-dependent methyltransferase [Deltaproteobacteria bacterium]|nr:class I SAM-dependent methyltransferase [Deltaproteobacteria bacterium]